mmetsp:Transcript_14421/g.43065  ORF Transcript_14421/g.43065 Transcript_14421/m.43065 type:complete len:833 (+) Transcript_14421:262-2760(+)
MRGHLGRQGRRGPRVGDARGRRRRVFGRSLARGGDPGRGLGRRAARRARGRAARRAEIRAAARLRAAAGHAASGRLAPAEPARQRMPRRRRQVRVRRGLQRRFQIRAARPRGRGQQRQGLRHRQRDLHGPGALRPLQRRGDELPPRAHRRGPDGLPRRQPARPRLRPGRRVPRRAVRRLHLRQQRDLGLVPPRLLRRVRALAPAPAREGPGRRDRQRPLIDRAQPRRLHHRPRLPRPDVRPARALGLLGAVVLRVHVVPRRRLRARDGPQPGHEPRQGGQVPHGAVHVGGRPLGRRAAVLEAVAEGGRALVRVVVRRAHERRLPGERGARGRLGRGALRRRRRGRRRGLRPGPHGGRVLRLALPPHRRLPVRRGGRLLHGRGHLRQGGHRVPRGQARRLRQRRALHGHLGRLPHGPLFGARRVLPRRDRGRAPRGRRLLPGRVHLVRRLVRGRQDVAGRGRARRLPRVLDVRRRLLQAGAGPRGRRLLRALAAARGGRHGLRRPEAVRGPGRRQRQLAGLGRRRAVRGLVQPRALPLGHGARRLRARPFVRRPGGAGGGRLEVSGRPAHAAAALRRRLGHARPRARRPVRLLRRRLRRGGGGRRRRRGPEPAAVVGRHLHGALRGVGRPLLLRQELREDAQAAPRAAGRAPARGARVLRRPRALPRAGPPALTPGARRARAGGRALRLGVERRGAARGRVRLVLERRQPRRGAGLVLEPLGGRAVPELARRHGRRRGALPGRGRARGGGHRGLHPRQRGARTRARAAPGRSAQARGGRAGRRDRAVAGRRLGAAAGEHGHARVEAPPAAHERAGGRPLGTPVAHEAPSPPLW